MRSVLVAAALVAATLPLPEMGKAGQVATHSDVRVCDGAGPEGAVPSQPLEPIPVPRRAIV